MEYVPLVNCTVLEAVPSMMSSMAEVMLPLPSATKLPTRPRKAPTFVLASVPLIENAYVPLRLALEKFPMGGGGGGADPLPPHAAANSPRPAAITIARCFTAHLPSHSRLLRS